MAWSRPAISIRITGGGWSSTRSWMRSPPRPASGVYARLEIRSGVGRGLADRLQQLRAAHALAVRGVETARHDKAGADHGPSVRNFTEDEEAEQADPQQLGVGERRE